MKAEFWHERWEKSQIGFHNQKVNALLAEYWPDLGIEKRAPVFVPLCGKSLDMHWLKEREHPVVGVELSPLAVHDFFSEAEISPLQARSGSLERFSSQGIDLYCGDLFELGSSELAGTRACYDRGALVALPPELRMRYAEHLARVLPTPMTILMITIEYDQSKMKGPPHSVSQREVEKLFGEDFEIERLWMGDWVEASPMFQARGLDTRRDLIFRLDRNSDDTNREGTRR